MQRRNFLINSSGFLFAITSPSMLLSACATSNLSGRRGLLQDLSGLSPQQWQTMEAVQQHLLPSEPNAPGAADINASRYLEQTLSEPGSDPQDRDFIRSGLLALDARVLKQFKTSFLQLSEQEKEQALRSYEQDTLGAAWLTAILEFTMEALLSNPVYGGNTDGVGWRWLKVNPGFPLTPPDKKYFLL